MILWARGTCSSLCHGPDMFPSRLDHSPSPVVCVRLLAVPLLYHLWAVLPKGMCATARVTFLESIHPMSRMRMEIKRERSPCTWWCCTLFCSWRCLFISWLKRVACCLPPLLRQPFPLFRSASQAVPVAVTAYGVPFHQYEEQEHYG